MKRVLAAIRRSAGRGFFARANGRMERGEFKAALDVWKDAQNYLEDGYGGEHSQTLQSIAAQGYCLVRLGRASESIPLFEYVISTEKRLHGDSKLSRAWESHLARARKEVTRPDVAGRAAFLNAKEKMDRGEYLAALEEWREAQQLLEDAYGREEPVTLQTIAAQGYSLVRLGRSAEAIRLFEDVLATEKRLHGDSEWSHALEVNLAQARNEAGGSST